MEKHGPWRAKKMAYKLQMRSLLKSKLVTRRYNFISYLIQLYGNPVCEAYYHRSRRYYCYIERCSFSLQRKWKIYKKKNIQPMNVESNEGSEKKFEQFMSMFFLSIHSLSHFNLTIFVFTFIPYSLDVWPLIQMYWPEAQRCQACNAIA